MSLQFERKRIAYHHAGGDQPLLGEPIHACIERVAERFPDCEALVSTPQGVRLTYDQFLHQVRLLAKGLIDIGIERGDRVGIWATDNVEWVLLQIASAYVGAVLVNINPASRKAELEHALRAARVHALVLMPAFRDSHYAEMAKSLDRSRLPDLRWLILFDPQGVQGPAEGFLRWRTVQERGVALEDGDAVLRRRAATLMADDPVNIQFTSGTTGFPKPVVLTHHNILNNGFFCGEVLGLTEHDRLCVPVPFYHCFGMVVSNLGCLTHGAAIVIPAEHFDTGATLAAIEKEKCTVLHGVPTMFVAELERPDFKSYDLSSLRTGIMAGAPCPPELMRRVIDEMGITEILIGYGQTESSPVTHLTRPTDSFERRIGSVGTNIPHQEVKLVSPDTGATVAVGEQGEICFRGYHVMRGYFEMPEATREAIDEAGWLHSGDLGEMDHDGYVKITGRLKEMIIRGGENVYPAEIEACLDQHESVAQAAVFGLPHEAWGEEVGAWVQLHEGETASAEELAEFVHERMAHFKVPTYIKIVETFPMTVTGKILKYKIQEIVQEERVSSA